MLGILDAFEPQRRGARFDVCLRRCVSRDQIGPGFQHLQVGLCAISASATKKGHDSVLRRVVIETTEEVENLSNPKHC